MKKGKEYELLVEQIYKELEGDAIITQDDHIFGLDTGIERQIDLSIRSKILDIDILIIVQVKDWTRKADVNTIGQFKSVIKDVRAQKGILICNTGFSVPAIDYAKKERIEVYSAHSAIKKKWSMELSIPVIKTEHACFLNFLASLENAPTECNKIDDFSYIFMKDGIILGRSEMYKRYFINRQPIDKSGKLIYFDVDPEGLFCINPTSGISTAVVRLQIVYRYEGHDVKSTSISPADYRVLKNHLNEEIITSHVEISPSLFPKLIGGSTWTTKDISNFDKNQAHLEVVAFRYSELYMYSLGFRPAQVNRK